MAPPAETGEDADTDDQPRIRILFAGLDRLLGDVVSELVNAQPDMEIVGSLRADEQLTAALERTGASVAVLSAGDEEILATAREVLGECVRFRLVGLDHGGRDTVVLELRPYWVRYGQLSPDGLVEAIRTAVRPPEWREERCEL